MQYLLFMIVSLALASATSQKQANGSSPRRHNSEPERSQQERRGTRGQSPRPRGSSPLVKPTKGQVSVHGPGLFRTATQGRPYTESLVDEFRDGSQRITNHEVSAVKSAVLDGGRGSLKVKGERAHFLLTTGNKGLATLVAEGHGHLAGAVITPNNVHPINEVVRGSTVVHFGPNVHAQGIHSNHGRGRGRVSLHGFHSDGSGFTAVGENRHPDDAPRP